MVCKPRYRQTEPNVPFDPCSNQNDYWLTDVSPVRNNRSHRGFSLARFHTSHQLPHIQPKKETHTVRCVHGPGRKTHAEFDGLLLMWCIVLSLFFIIFYDFVVFRFRFLFYLLLGCLRAAVWCKIRHGVTICFLAGPFLFCAVWSRLCNLALTDGARVQPTDQYRLLWLQFQVLRMAGRNVDH